MRAALDDLNQQALPLGAAVQKLTSARVLELEEENRVLAMRLDSAKASVECREVRLEKFERIALDLRALHERRIDVGNEDDLVDALVRELLELVPPTDGAHAAVSS